MADKKISELNNAALPLTGAELVPIVQDGETVKVELSEISGNNANLISTDPDNAIELGTDGKLLVKQPKQYKFLLSQTGGDDPQTATSGTLTQGVTYEIVAFETGDDFTPSGAPNNDVGTKWIANGVAPTWSNGSEIGWNNGAPTVTEFINTIGHVWWERAGDGYYQLISNGLFTDGKTFLTPYLYSGLNIYFELGFDGIPNIILFYSNQLVYFPQSNTLTDGLFINHPFTIEIYP